jgi:hypothetical protein
LEETSSSEGHDKSSSLDDSLLGNLMGLFDIFFIDRRDGDDAGAYRPSLVLQIFIAL